MDPRTVPSPATGAAGWDAVLDGFEAALEAYAALSRGEAGEMVGRGSAGSATDRSSFPLTSGVPGDLGPLPPRLLRRAQELRVRAELITAELERSRGELAHDLLKAPRRSPAFGQSPSVSRYLDRTG